MNKSVWSILLVTLCVSIVLASIPRERSSFKSRRFSIHEKYIPKYWNLVPRTEPFPEHLRDIDSSPDDYFTFIPTYIGSVLPGKTLTWNSTCFQSCQGSITINGNNSAHLVMSMNQKKTLLCNELYLIGYVGSFDIVTYEFSGDHGSTWNGGWPVEEIYDLQNNGLRLFRFPDATGGTAEEVFETMMLFFGALIGAHVPDWTAEDNIKFLKDHMNIVMEERPIQRVDIPTSEVQSGDFLGIIRMDGLDPMLAWGMGSHTGHTTITWWIDNELYVLESTISSNYWPTNGIQKTPWTQWLTQAQAAGYNVVHLPLNPAIAAKLDSNSALAFFRSVEGIPYGFHNQFTGWIDTPEDNYPPPLHSQAVMLLLSYAEWFLASQGNTFDFSRQTFNKRLGTNGLSMNQVYMEAGKRGWDFHHLITMPEQDEWIFEDNNNVTGPSMVCDVFVTEMWKAAGVFRPDLVNQIQATEFTNWDAYSLNIFNANYKRPSQCVEADPDSQFCQLLGKYRMTLPGYNTVTPFPHMRERCPSEAPLYIKPEGC